jgi:prephenate dehydratase
MGAPMNTISFQGMPGAYSHQACVEAFPGMETLPCGSFEQTIAAVKAGRAGLAMLPVENSTYGRVADIHRLLPESGLHIVGEAFVRVRINLLALPGVTLDAIDRVRAHLVLLPQCRGFLDRHGIAGEAYVDSAGAAADLAAHPEPGLGVLASELAAEIYGLDVLARDIEDHGHNTTRFLVMSPEPRPAPGGDVLTTFVFNVRNIPAALYKAMGGFATNGVNMTKLESYMEGGHFTATQFYADIEGHPDDPAVARALEELDYFTDSVQILGVYPVHPFRRNQLGPRGD